MQAKLFMIPWFVGLAVSQRTPVPADSVVPAPSAQTLTNDLLVDAHRRHFYEMLRRQQQINDALLLNNALLHPHIPPLQIPSTEPLIPPAPLFNPFSHQPQSAGSTSKLGTYGQSESTEEVKEEKENDEQNKEETETKHTESSESFPEETEGTVEAPHREPEAVRKSAAGVKTVLIQKKGDVVGDQEKLVSTTTLSPEHLEVVQLFKKLNLSKEETKSIVEKVEQVVREKLNEKFRAQELSAPTINVVTTSTVLPTTTTTTTEVIPTTELIVKEENIESVTSESAPPKTNSINEKNLILQRNNLKHHPIKLQRKKLVPVAESDEVSQGSIKTSLTHLPIIVANEEEDVIQKATLHKRVLIASQNHEKDSEKDLLVDFATGAPLDLTDLEGTKVAVSSTTLPPPTLTPVQPPRKLLSQSILPPRQPHHEVTNFERLATDYRRRLENTGDIHKILQKISENAYISLVERGGPRKVFGN